MRIVLGLDLDGCLYDWHSAVYTYFQYERGYEKDYVTFWNEFPLLKSELQDYIVSLPFLYESVLPSKQVKEFLEFAKDRSEIYYITKRPECVESATRRYLKKNNFPFQDNLYITGDKATTCRMFGITHFLDDFPSHLEKIKGIAECYLMAKPWNFEFRDEYKTVYGIKEFQNEVFGT